MQEGIVQLAGRQLAADGVCDTAQAEQLPVDRHSVDVRDDGAGRVGAAPAADPPATGRGQLAGADEQHVDIGQVDVEVGGAHVHDVELTPAQHALDRAGAVDDGDGADGGEH